MKDKDMGKEFIKKMNDYRATQAAASPAHRQMMDMMKEQLLIVLIERLGGDIEIPVAEIDNTGDKLMSFQLTPGKNAFRFVVSRKS